ncbi:MAG TPA: helix-turn-helix domain-containing protein [Streptosporangiaceae bacterium]|jgi:DNA-binding transcriptional MerR regulator
MDARLTIGDFSRIAHLNVKTLRHYHHVGLLEPSSVDAHTGYRYYSDEQIPLAQVIRRLRDLEMPIPDVKAVLAAPEASVRNTLIAAHLDSLETELARTRQAVGALRDLIQRPDTPPVEDTPRAIGRVVALVVPPAISPTVHPRHHPMEDRDRLAHLRSHAHQSSHDLAKIVDHESLCD